MKLTENFWLDEFIESDFYDEISQQKVWVSYNENAEYLLPNIQKLANQLQVLRNVLDTPIHINIGFRPLWWELQQGRNGNSQHVHGKAADFRVEGMKPNQIYSIMEFLIDNGHILQGGLGLYSSWIHYDTRKKKARW